MQYRMERKSPVFDKLSGALIITKREVRDQFRDWRIIFPILGLTLFFPFLMNFTARTIMNFVENYGASILGERMVPFLLMVVGFFPISVSLVIALESFVGEKERGSIEPLLNTPLEDWQLYLGKLLSSTIPPLASSYLGMAVYLVGLQIKGVPIPDFPILFQIIILTTVQAVMMVSGAVVVSTQATSVRAANLLASFIIIPSALLIQGESIVMFWGNNTTLWWVVAGVVLLTILFVRVGLAHFHREELLGREIDVLNIRWGFRLFFKQFSGEAASVGDWYMRVLPAALRKLGLPILLVSVIVVASFIIGYFQIDRFQVELSNINLDNISDRVASATGAWGGLAAMPVTIIWWQNVRALLIGLVLGIFSLGILSPIPIIATMGLAGYLMALLQTGGVSVLSYLVLLLPHGVIEIPAAVIATAAVMRVGGLIATPVVDKPVAEVLIVGLADWAKIMLGLVIPLLLIAAAVESWVTPQVAVWFLS